MDDRERLKQRIGTLQTVYVVLFLASLVMLCVNWLVLHHTLLGTLAWALTLGGAVVARVYRTSLVNRYNAGVERDDAPLR